jgi:hypothetical protein
MSNDKNISKDNQYLTHEEYRKAIIAFDEDMKNGRIVLTEDLLESKEKYEDGSVNKTYLLPDGRRIGTLEGLKHYTI